MGMADLKKTCSKPYKLAEFDVDDFIDDVDNYIHGRQSFIFPPQLTVVEKPVEALEQTLKAAVDKRKNATFSLTNCSIATLSELSSLHQINKSKLLRLLIAHFAELDEIEQQALLRQVVD